MLFGDTGSGVMTTLTKLTGRGMGRQPRVARQGDDTMRWTWFAEGDDDRSRRDEEGKWNRSDRREFMVSNLGICDG